MFYKKITLSSILFLVVFGLSAQKYRIIDNDTFNYISSEGEKFTINGENYYRSQTICNTFEKIDDSIVNYLDEDCKRQGTWIIMDSTNSYVKINYKNDNVIGSREYYDDQNYLVREVEKIQIFNDKYIVKDIKYEKGKETKVVNRIFLAFYLNNIKVIIFILAISFFVRIFINSRIYNIEHNTNLSPIYFFASGYVAKNFTHSLYCTFTFWFSNYKPQNKKLVYISNILSITFLSVFFGTLIGLVVSGEI